MAGRVRVLNVAEKPSVAQGIAALLAKGQAVHVRSLSCHANHLVLPLSDIIFLSAVIVSRN